MVGGLQVSTWIDRTTQEFRNSDALYSGVAPTLWIGDVEAQAHAVEQPPHVAMLSDRLVDDVGFAEEPVEVHSIDPTNSRSSSSLGSVSTRTT